MDWKKPLGSIAPVIGTALGGPFGGLAGTVLGSFLGVEDPTDEEVMEQAVTKAMADPDLVMKLKLAEKDFLVKMKELDIKEDDLVYKDKQDARKMQRETKSPWPGILSFVFTAGWIGLNYFIFTSDGDIPNVSVVMRVLGTADAALMLILSFWFGSSNGSQDKNRMLGRKEQ